MHPHVRAKRASGPLDAAAKARLCAPARPAAQWDAATCLSGLVHDFLAGTPNPDPADDHDLDAAGNSSGDDCPLAGDRPDLDLAAASAAARLSGAADGDQYRRRLARDVAASIEALTWLRLSAGEGGFRRAVMSRLRVFGHNAGVCTASWEAAGGLAAGSYEYIDVLAPARYVVDLEFANEFEVARATDGYQMVLSAIPKVLVAPEAAVAEVVRAAADAARRSLRARGLHVPPWRKRRYMMAKWIGPHKRTTVVGPTASVVVGGEVKCRAVGFGAAAGMVAAPAV